MYTSSGWRSISVSLGIGVLLFLHYCGVDGILYSEAMHSLLLTFPRIR